MIPRVYKVINKNSTRAETINSLFVDFNICEEEEWLLSDYLLLSGHTASGRRPSGKAWWIIPTDCVKVKTERI